MDGRTDDESVAGAARAAREQELLRRYHHHGDTRARDRLAEEMLPLARALAGRYAGRGEPLDDLVQVACVGIMKAIEGFELGRSPTVAELAEAVEAPFEEVLATLQSVGARRTRSLDEPAGDDRDMTLA